LLGINEQLQGTALPRISAETQQRILRSDPFRDWWKGDNPLI
jgi:hypothetical protein